MSNARDNAIWPVVGVLLCLFVLSTLSPRAWERPIRDEPVPASHDSGSIACVPPTEEPMADEHRSVAPQLATIPSLVEVPDQPPAVPEVLPASDEAAQPAAMVASLPALVPQDLPEPALIDSPASTPEEANPTDEPDDAVDNDACIDTGPSLEAAKTSDIIRLPVPDEPVAPIEPIGIRYPATLAPEPEPEADAEPAPSPPASVWCEPVGLLDYLSRLSNQPKAAQWAQEVQDQVQQLATAVDLHSDEAMAVVDRLMELCQEAERLATDLAEQPTTPELRRARHALYRRARIWKQVLSIGGVDAMTGRHAEPDPKQLASCLNDVDEFLAGLPAPEPWRSYLELKSLRNLSDPSAEIPSQLLAAEILRRLSRVPMTPEQMRIASSPPLTRLAGQLRYWASDPAPVHRLLESLERYEHDGLSSDARVLATETVRLMSSPVPQERRLGELLEAYYRNANFRVTVTADLLNRLVPDRKPVLESVDDHVLGQPVRGQALTTTKVAFRFLPDDRRLRAALEIRGQVASETASNSGPATVFNSSWSDFAASKEIELGVHGVALQPAEVDVQNQTMVRSVRTEFDAVPLLGSVAQGIARSQAKDKQPQIRREVEWKLSNRVKRQIDREADSRLVKASDRLKQHLFDPLTELALGPTIVSAKTTEERMTMRLRLAAAGELGAHTPRPRALNNSLASLQIHESALVNMVEQLNLSGQTLTLAELRQRIATRFDRPEMLDGETENDGITIRFADDNPVQVHCRDGQVLVQVSVGRLFEPKSGEQWENFQVRAFYRPQISRGRAEFAREGVIQLIGDGLNLRSQIALRGIFSKTFSKQRPLVLTPDSMLEDQRLAGLGVSQIVLDDGWASVAFGPLDTTPDAVAARAAETVDQ